MRKKLFVLFLTLSVTLVASAQQVAELLNRAPVAVLTKGGVLVSWRFLNTDGDATFTINRNGTQVATGISTKTNWLDAAGKPGDVYEVVSSKGDKASVKAWDSFYTTIELTRPAAVKDVNGSSTGRYRPDDASVADVDGDGEYELILKWLPDNQRDSGANKGSASPTYLSCYEMNGTLKWTVNIGHNIRSGNHTVQFVVYDLDGDGKAEMLCKTAPGSTDGQGKYVTDAATDAGIKGVDNTQNDVNSNGLVVKGPEFLTVFNGETGAAMHTIYYSPDRGGNVFPNSAAGANSSSYFGDSNCNRAERFNAAVAYLDGLDHLPTAIFQRGYYKACFVWAVDYRDSKLQTRWLHRGTSATAWDVRDANSTVLASQDTDPVSSTGKSSFGQGVHGISVGDVNGDGKDEICIGAATIASDGKLMCATGFGHGDAIHLADLVPDRPGLEVMMPHEETPFGYDVHDAATGEILCSAHSDKDNGRGLAGDFIPGNRVCEFWSSADGITRSCADGTTVVEKKSDTNFRIYWTGDPYDQTFDGRYNSTNLNSAPRICIYNTEKKGFAVFQEFADYGNPLSCNTTKATPVLQADILGDWREELIMMEYENGYNAKTVKLHIYSTPEPTEYKVPCLMQDHVYRMGIVWQNSSYNQPPHLGYYLPDYLGVDMTTYKTKTVTNSAPEPYVDPDAPKVETVKAPAEDKAIVKGICYTAGEKGEYTNSTSGSYIKVRTNNNGETITYSVNEGYVITGMTIEAYSNNTSTTADRSITLTDILVDGTPTGKSVVFPGGTAGQTPGSVELTNISATQNIVLTFDNSKIVDSATDAAGKNKQIFSIVTFTYKEKATGIENIESVAVPVTSVYNLAGQRVAPNTKGIVVINGKKYLNR